MPDNLKIGDVVQLKSGGPLMTISNIESLQYQEVLKRRFSVDGMMKKIQSLRLKIFMRSSCVMLVDKKDYLSNLFEDSEGI